MIAYHFVMCPKFRRAIFAEPRVKTELDNVFRGECRNHGWNILAFEIMPDHLHLLLEVPNTETPAHIANILKGISSRHLRQHIPVLKDLINKKCLWATGYYCEGVGNTGQDAIKKYIQNQEANWIKVRR